MDVSPPASMDFQGCSQIFKEQIPTLLRLAAFKIARSLSYNIIFNENFDENKMDFTQQSVRFDFKGKTKQSSQSLRNEIPYCLISGAIDNAIMEFYREINLWIIYNQRPTLPDRKMRIYRDYLKCLVWQFNCKIDHSQTAREMVSSEKFTEYLGPVDKFAIMCRYCLYDKFEKFDTNEELESIIEGVISQKKPRLAFYWICKMRNELSELQVGPNFESVESYMVTKTRAGDLLAIEYFWSCLSERDKVTKYVQVTSNSTLFFHLKTRLLSKMNDTQVGQVFCEIPVDIMSRFWFIERKIMLLIWNRIRHWISNEQFRDLLERLSTNLSPEKIPFIIRIWDMSYDYQKKFVLDQEKSIILICFFLSSIHRTPKVLQFLYTMLSYSSPTYRKEFFLEQGVNLVNEYHYHARQPDVWKSYEDHFSAIDNFIKLCLPNDSDVIEFKKQMMKSPAAVNFCKSDFPYGDFKYLNMFVKFYAPDESSMFNFKHLIIDSIELKTWNIFHLGNWSEVEKFVDDAYPDAPLAENFKRQLILTSGTRGLCHSMNVDSLRSMINISAQFLTVEEMVKMKESLLDQFRKQILVWDFWKSFDETYLREFASFCFDNEEKINEFKASIPIDEIFKEKLESMIPRHILLKDFVIDMISVVNNFLEWYLVEPEKVKKFKFRRIFEFEDLSIVEKFLFPRKNEMDAKTLLVWFLSNDEEQICKFKTKFSDKTVLQLI